MKAKENSEKFLGINQLRVVNKFKFIVDINLVCVAPGFKSLRWNYSTSKGIRHDVQFASHALDFIIDLIYVIWVNWEEIEIDWKLNTRAFKDSKCQIKSPIDVLMKNILGRESFHFNVNHLQLSYFPRTRNKAPLWAFNEFTPQTWILSLLFNSEI